MLLLKAATGIKIVDSLESKREDVFWQMRHSSRRSKLQGLAVRLVQDPN